MLRNYFKTAIRSLWHTKLHAAINVFGLSVGVLCCTLIALFVKDEWTFDTFHEKAGRIFRVWVREDWGPNQQFTNTVTPFPLGPALRDNFQEVEQQVRINKIGTQVKVGDHHFSEFLTFGGQNFFDVFDFNISMGNREVLKSANTIVINAFTAHKYFGTDSPIGKIISIQLGEGFEDFVVGAVVTNLPHNSSIRFALLISDLNYQKLYSAELINNDWFDVTPETYMLLREGVDPKVLERKFPSVLITAMGKEDYEKSKYTAGLQPITSIHLGTDLPVGIADVSDPKYSYILSAIALLVLVVACINFVTLAVGRSAQRAKEVGIRKVAGAYRQQLMLQFTGEAIILTAMAIVLGVAMSVIALPLFNDLSGKGLTMRPDFFLFATACALLIVIGIMAGSYPAFVLSGIRPIATLKGYVGTGNSKQGLRKVLVGVQLVLSIFLISSTLIMRRQLDFLRHKNLGFDKEQLLVVPVIAPRGARLVDRIISGFERAEIFKTELARIADIASVGGSSYDFGTGDWTNVGYTDDQGNYRTFNVNFVDDDYIPTLRMELISGRNFSDAVPGDAKRAVIINEAFAKEYEWTDPIGKILPGKKFPGHEVIGVVKDFNYESLYRKVAPLMLTMNPMVPLAGAENVNMGFPPIPKLMIRLKAGSAMEALEKIEAVWQKLTGGEEFSFTFVDEALDRQYRTDQNLGRIVTIATSLALLMGGLGLYALATLAMQNRTKEISIRKVLGATEKSLLALLYSDYLFLVSVSLVLSIPLTWYLMREWLQSFEYRIAVGWEAFALSGVLSLIIMALAVGHQAIKIAWSRPAETLKYE